MATSCMLRVAVCLASLAGVKSLLVKQEPRTLAESQPSKNSGGLEVEWCSLEQDSTNEMYMAREKEQSCMYPSASGVDFVSFVRRPANKRLVSGPEGGAGAHTLKKDEKASEWGDGHHGNLKSYGALGDACIEECKEAGYCPWCGDGNACCGSGDAGSSKDPPECQGAKFSTDTSTHVCVEPPIDEFQAKYAKSKDQLVVWVSGYPRSGSSTLLSMVSATVDDNRAGGHTFSLFEPCHDDDEYNDWLSKKGCRQLLFDVSRCEFGGVKQLWGWRDPHSTNNFTKDFSNDIATEMCKEADIIAFKTVDWGHDLSKWSWLLNSRQQMKVLDMVRDPRAIFASWKRLSPFKELVASHDFYSLSEICDHFAKNLDNDDKRVKRVIFEDLMKDPKTVTQDVYKFLGQAYTTDEEKWVQGAFNAKDCPPPAPGMEGFTDCHTSSGIDPRGDEKWRDVLTSEELAIFENSNSCQKVAKAYRYPPK